MQLVLDPINRLNVCTVRCMLTRQEQRTKKSHLKMLRHENKEFRQKFMCANRNSPALYRALAKCSCSTHTSSVTTSLFACPTVTVLLFHCHTPLSDSPVTFPRDIVLDVPWVVPTGAIFGASGCPKPECLQHVRACTEDNRARS